MAYQCQNFKDGQVLTAECLNKIERALEGVCKKEIQAISVNAQNEIIVTFADGSTMNCGKVNVSGGGSGADGITPNIGPNGNWWIGGTDTGVKAAGTNGTNGSNGVSISSVVQTTTSSADGGSNIITVTLSNGTTSTFTVKNGDTGAPGVHVGTEPPTNGETVWIDTDEGASDDGDGGAQIDVVASVGQVLAVKAVDVYGKPTEYKAVDLPSVPTPNLAANEGEEGYVEGRTHYIDKSGIVHKLDNKYIDADWMATSEEGGGKVVFIPEQTVSGGLWSNLQADFVKGENYVVEVNGLEYICKCLECDGELYLGNGTLMGGTEHNNEPFCITQMIGTTGGMFFSDGTLEAPIGLKVTDWVAVIYNKLPEEFLPDCVVKREDIENIEVNWDNVTDKPFVEGAGEPFFEHTATFTSDAAAQNGIQVAGVSTSSYRDKIYWLEVNGELLKCHWESVTLGAKLCDEDGNCWVTNNIAGVYVSAPTAGTYTYKLYAPSDELMLEPQYLPPHLAKKHDIPNVSGMVKSVNGNTPDKNGNVQIETGGGSANIDVTAQVGQTIIVKEVDENGKPTKWESAEYQPRTHWDEMKEVVPLTTITPFYYEALGVPMGTMADFDIVVGNKYKVAFDGVEYVCEAFMATTAGMSAPAFGNAAVTGGANTGEPFGIFKMAGDSWSTIVLFDMNPHSVRIEAEVAVPIEEKYMTNAFPYYIEVTGIGTDGDPYVVNETVANFNAVYDSGRQIVPYIVFSDEYGTSKTYMSIHRFFVSNSIGRIYSFYWFDNLGPASSDLKFVTLYLIPQPDGTFKASRTFG